MALGAPLWKASEGFYRQLTLAQHGDPLEQRFAGRGDLVTLFPKYEAFWRLHVCPATRRPLGTDFRGGTSDIVCKLAELSYSVLNKLLDAADSLALVLVPGFARASVYHERPCTSERLG